MRNWLAVLGLVLFVYNYLTRKSGSGVNTSLQLTTVSLLLSVSPFENVTLISYNHVRHIAL